MSDVNMNSIGSLFIIILLGTSSTALVTIDQASFPLYVQSGGNLTLLCTSSDSKQLEWVQQTPGTNLEPEVIVPTLGGPFITRYLIEKPSGYVESTLVKDNMDLSDGGLYQCRDLERQNTFGLWATVLYINNNVKVYAEPKRPVDMYCSIAGFSSNPPQIVYDWFYKELLILTPHEHYDIVKADGRTELTITNPVKSDGGEYMCSFTLSTNKGAVTFSEIIVLDTSRLEDSGGTSLVLDGKALFFTCLLAILWQTVSFVH